MWFCKFSNNGKKLATGSKDGCLVIWDVDPETYKLTLNKSYDDHSYGVALVAWSPDDRYLIVCGTEECSELWIWDIEVNMIKYNDTMLIANFFFDDRKIHGWFLNR